MYGAAGGLKHAAVQAYHSKQQNRRKFTREYSGNTNCNESTTAGNFEINFVEFDGVKLVRNDETGHVVILNSNVTLQLPFLFYGNFPPIMLDIYSRSDSGFNQFPSSI